MIAALETMPDRPSIPEFNAEKWHTMLAIIRAEPGVEIRESLVPLPTQEELEAGDFSGFANLPPFWQRSVRRFSYSCRMYASGFVMLDHREKLERDAWETNLQEHYKDDFNFVYDWSRMRANMMVKILQPLTLIAPDILKKEKSEITPVEQTFVELSRRLPKPLFPPALEEVVYDPARNVRELKPIPRYIEFTNDEKLQVVAEVDRIARAFRDSIGAPIPPPRTQESEILL